MEQNPHRSRWKRDRPMLYCEIQARDIPMKKRLILLLFITLFIGSCAPVAASPTQPTTATAAQSIAPSETPSPTNTATPTPTPQTQEHLLVTRDHEHWAVLNADGSLQKYIQISDIAIAAPSGISPDG